MRLYVVFRARSLRCRVPSCRQWRLLSTPTGYTPPLQSSSGEALPSGASAADPSTWTSTSSPLDTVAHASGVPELVPAVDDLASLGLGGYTPVGLLQTVLDTVHFHTGLPWWATIAGATVALRIALLPLAFKMQVNAAKLQNLQPETSQIMERAKYYRSIGDSKSQADEAVKLIDLYRSHQCSPVKMFVMPLAQVPIFISFFMALRKMAAAPLESMKEGGALWFTDLTAIDTTYVLPLLAAGSFLLNVELGGESSSTQDNPTHKMTKNILRVMSVAILPISINFPSGLFMYWVTNSLFSTAQILCFKNHTVRKFLNIPMKKR